MGPCIWTIDGNGATGILLEVQDGTAIWETVLAFS